MLIGACNPTCVPDLQVWVHNIQVVVMVARVVEMGKKKCEKYWPDDGSAMKYGEVIIHNDEVDETNLPNFVRRTMRITVGDQTRKLTHFQYLAWPDHGVPDSPKTVMQMLRQVREAADVILGLFLARFPCSMPSRTRRVRAVLC